MKKLRIKRKVNSNSDLNVDNQKMKKGPQNLNKKDELIKYAKGGEDSKKQKKKKNKKKPKNMEEEKKIDVKMVDTEVVNEDILEPSGIAGGLSVFVSNIPSFAKKMFGSQPPPPEPEEDNYLDQLLREEEAEKEKKMKAEAKKKEKKQKELD